MRLKEYLEELEENEQVTFIVMEVKKSESGPFYDTYYRTTPIRCTWEWKNIMSEDKLNQIVVVKDHAPIDSTGGWTNWYKNGHLKCCMLVSEETLFTEYSDEQAQKMIDYYERTVK